MGFLRKLFGGDSTSEVKIAARENYGGFELRAAPTKDPNGWRVAGSVAKEVGGEVKVHQFVRADTYPNHDDAVTVSLRKGRQLVDERGDALFS